MKFLLANISCEKSSLLEDSLDNNFLKEIAFTAKYKKPKLEYDNVLIPVVLYNTLQKNTEEYTNFILCKDWIKEYTNIEVKANENDINTIIYSLYCLLKDLYNNRAKLRTIVYRVIDDSELSIFYTDGSASKKSDCASYACCKLTTEDISGTVDEFTGKSFCHEEYFGKIDQGTNNIGELTAIREAVKHITPEKQYQLIISDSSYGIKTYREYIHVWEANNYLAYNKKEIKNKELIINTYNEIKKAQKETYIFFKWTKGHAKNMFNERCDIIAKDVLGI